MRAHVYLACKHHTHKSISILHTVSTQYTRQVPSMMIMAEHPWALAWDRDYGNPRMILKGATRGKDKSAVFQVPTLPKHVTFVPIRTSTDIQTNHFVPCTYIVQVGNYSLDGGGS